MRDRYTQMSFRNRTRIVRLPGPRGRLYDRNGRLLVDNKAGIQLVAIANQINDVQSFAEEVSNLTRLSSEYIIKKVKENIFKPFIPSVLAMDLNIETLVNVAEARYRIPGLNIQVVPIRDYICGEAFSHIVGYVGEVGRSELDMGYSWGDIVGRSGIEKVLDKRLRGEDGWKEVQVDYKGNVDSILKVVGPRIGDSIYLTIDSVLQEELYNSLKKYKGAGVVMDANSGEILALVSSPGFDPNLLVSPVREDVVKKLFMDNDRPMVNRAVMGLYPPGSIFKIIVALSALEKGIITQKSLFYCDGEFQLGDTKFRCWEKKGHGWVDLSNALKKSCNEYFYQVGLKTGAGSIIDMAGRFGLGRTTGIDLPGEKSGLLPDIGSNWASGDTVNLSIGHGKILVTPIQIACLISSIANGGVLYRPILVLGEKSEGRKIDIHREYIDMIKDGLRRAVNDPDGTGHMAYVSGLDIIGKTGTVELKEGRKKRNICWFAGAQINTDEETQINADSKRQIAVAIVVEEGESGGATCAPIAQRIFKNRVASNE